MASVKCPVCGNRIEKESAVHVGRRYCCAEHAKQYETELKKTKSKPAQSSSAPPVQSGYKELIEAVCQAFDIDAPTGMILKQIQNYKKAYDFTYNGMRFTLQYCLHWSKQASQLNLEHGLSFIPYKYHEAREFFERLKESARHTQQAGAEISSQTINIDADKLERARFRRTGYIDIELLE